jgi:hypothetical protein
MVLASSIAAGSKLALVFKIEIGFPTKKAINPFVLLAKELENECAEIATFPAMPFIKALESDRPFAFKEVLPLNGPFIPYSML